MALFVVHKLIRQTRMRSHPVALDVWFIYRPFVYFHTSCLRTAKALTRLRGCAGSPEPSLIAYVISTIISWAGSNRDGVTPTKRQSKTELPDHSRQVKTKCSVSPNYQLFRLISQQPVLCDIPQLDKFIENRHKLLYWGLKNEINMPSNKCKRYLKSWCRWSISIWAAAWQNRQSDSAQRRLRSAWASAQSDQSLRCALNG